MNIKKIGGSLAVAIATLTMSGLAQAEDLCSLEAQRIEDISFELICAYGENSVPGGEWNWDAIWQHKGSKGDGCKVHLGLAKQLFVPHDDPPSQRGKGNGFRQAKGAANALRDHKYEDALAHLQNVVDTIDNSARLNLAFRPRKVEIGGVIVERGADYFASQLRNFAAGMKLKIYDPATGQGCSVAAP